MKINLLQIVVFLFWLLPICLSAQETKEGRFRDLGGGVIEDSVTHLQWTQRDNGRTINGEEATRYCQNIQLSGGHWRLPTISELETICSSKYNRPYFYEGETKTCGVHPLFHITGWALWSTTRSAYNPNDGRIFNITLYLDCQKISMDVSENPYIAPFGRAICVRCSSK